MTGGWWVISNLMGETPNKLFKTCLYQILDHHYQKRFFGETRVTRTVALRVTRAQSHFVWLLWISRWSPKGVCKGTTTGIHKQVWNKIIEKRREYRKRCTPSPNSHQIFKPIKKKEKTFEHIFIKHTAHMLISLKMKKIKGHFEFPSIHATTYRSIQPHISRLRPRGSFAGTRRKK